MTCVRCSEPLTGKRTRFCSNNCRNVHGVTEWRRNMKKWAIEYLGGKCSKCGYNKCQGALVFHHVSGDKEFTISNSGITRSQERMKAELAKCVLLCANCHAEEHWLIDNGSIAK